MANCDICGSSAKLTRQGHSLLCASCSSNTELHETWAAWLAEQKEQVEVEREIAELESQLRHVPADNDLMFDKIVAVLSLGILTRGWPRNPRAKERRAAAEHNRAIRAEIRRLQGLEAHDRP